MLVCKSIAEGGQRCAGHTRPVFDAALMDYRSPYLRKMRADIRGREPDNDVGAEDRLADTAAQYASTKEGAVTVAAEMRNAGERGRFEEEAILRNALSKGAAIRAGNGAAAEQADPNKIPGVKNSSYDPVVVKVDEERGITYTWHDASPDRQDIGPRDKGIETGIMILTDREGNRVGHLRVSFSNRQIVKSRFPTLLHWKAENSGIATLGPNGGTLREQWCSVYSSSRTHGRPKSMEGKTPSGRWGEVTEDDAPATEAEIMADFEETGKQYEDEYRRWVRWANVPFVAYSKIEEGHRGTGLGADMYVETAKQLGRQGRVLRASDSQTDYAKNVWRKFKEHGMPVKRRRIGNPYSDGTSMCEVLDFRDQG